MKTAIGIITRHVHKGITIDKFITNAQKYGHEIDAIIIAYQDKIDWDYIHFLERLTAVHLIKVSEKSGLCDELMDLGVAKDHIRSLLKCDQVDPKRIMPYGKNRNNVLIKAMLIGMDLLFFVDTDVYPELILKKGPGYIREEIDYIGEHLNHLEREEVAVTTSDYSGYYIIPPMLFPGMSDLLRGLQKESTVSFMLKSHEHKGFSYQALPRSAVYTDKILGGNVALKLAPFHHLMPFFSSTYTFGEETFLTRGEDTLMGIELKNSKRYKAVDIDLKIFHNTYGDYPLVPNIVENRHVRRRFFYACMGWIGRNPFLNWLHRRDLERLHREQREALVKGSRALFDYLKDDRFLVLPEALDASYGEIDRYIEEYKEQSVAWRAFIERLEERSGS